MSLNPGRIFLGRALGLSLLAGIGCGGSSNPPPAPANLTYSTGLIQTVVDEPLPPIRPTVTGRVDGFAILPLLPPGLTFDTQTGAIAGTPTSPSAEAAYTVMAYNGSGLASTQFQLFVAGRVPDLRWQWTGAFPATSLLGASYALGTPPDGAQGVMIEWSGLAHAGPLEIANPTGDGWACLGVAVNFPLVGGSTSTFTADHLAVLDQRLDGFAAHGLVVTSLDLSVRGFGVVASGPRDGRLEYATLRTTFTTLGELASWAATQGQGGGIVTAVAIFGKPYDNARATGPFLALAATRQGDNGTYETQVVSGTPVELSQLLPPLGQQGYVVTAFGAGNQAVFVAVLTRPVGNTTPHLIEVQGPALPAGHGYSDGFVAVGRMTQAAGVRYQVFQR